MKIRLTKKTAVLTSELLFLSLAVEPHDRGDAESRESERADHKSCDDEGRGEPDLFGQEPRTEQSDSRRKQPEAVIERHHASQDTRVDAGLYDRDE